MELGAKIRETREQKGITLRRLAKEIGVSPSFISQVEQSKAKPSIDSLKQIASVLNVSCSYLIGEETNYNIDYTEKKENSKNAFNSKKFFNTTVKKLIPENLNTTMNPSLLILEAGAYSEDDLSQSSGEEFLLLLSGQLEINLNDKNYMLKEGDNIYFNSSVKHSFKNPAEQPAKVLWIKAS
jgi:transcriptional regulator with XRE-family HTH domain